MGLTATEKQSYEEYFIHGDFSDVMESGEIIQDATWSVTAEDAGVVDDEGNYTTPPEDATDTVTDQGSIYADEKKLYVRIKGGSEDEGKSPYHITFKVVTSLGNKWEVDGQIKIKET